LAGFAWMLASGLCFVGVNIGVKWVGDGLPPQQSAFLRFALGLVYVLPVAGLLVRDLPRGRDLRLYAIRGAVHTVGVLLWFYGITRIKLAEVSALLYLTPIFVTMGAALFLGERLKARRLLAIAAGILGALMILRPGVRDLDPGHLAVLGTAVFFGASYLIAKGLTGRHGPGVIVAMLSITVTVGLIPFAAAVWVTPTWEQLAVMFAVASFATGGHYAMTRAFQAAPVSVTQPAAFLQLVWATLFGWVLFLEPPDAFVIAGGAVIVAAVSFIAWREAVAHRRAVTPASDQAAGP
jgi:drug/metabolite transporter (DMT)-like permease